MSIFSLTVGSEVWGGGGVIVPKCLCVVSSAFRLVVTFCFSALKEARFLFLHLGDRSASGLAFVAKDENIRVKSVGCPIPVSGNWLTSALLSEVRL